MKGWREALFRKWNLKVPALGSALTMCRCLLAAFKSGRALGRGSSPFGRLRAACRICTRWTTTRWYTEQHHSVGKGCSRSLVAEWRNCARSPLELLRLRLGLGDYEREDMMCQMCSFQAQSRVRHLTSASSLSHVIIVVWGQPSSWAAGSPPHQWQNTE